jgi:hypothetical protein
VGMRGGLGDHHCAHTRPAPRSMNAVRPCCVVEPSPGDPLVTARVHGALSAVPIYLGTLVNTLLLCYVRLQAAILRNWIGNSNRHNFAKRWHPYVLSHPSGPQFQRMGAAVAAAAAAMT